MNPDSVTKVTAHGLLHSAGVPGVMSVAPVNGFTDTDSDSRLESYYYFRDEDFDILPDAIGMRNSVNCRNVLGIHTVAIGW